MRVTMVFIDGVGLGEHGPNNPFAFVETPHLSGLLGGGSLTISSAGFEDNRVSLLALDAAMGVPGLPQSATGQAALFSGENAPRLLGRHINGFPNRELRELLANKGIFKQLQQLGHDCTFLNAYRPSFFNHLAGGLAGNRFSCTTLINYYAGLPFRNLEHLREGKALYMDITNAFLGRMGFFIPEITAGEAGRRLAELSLEYSFSLFESYTADLAGHLGERPEAEKLVSTLDTFLGAAVTRMDPAQTMLIITSDHGNLENISHRRHTENPVPALLVGPLPARREFAAGMKDLTHLLPCLKQLLSYE